MVGILDECEADLELWRCEQGIVRSSPVMWNRFSNAQRSLKNAFNALCAHYSANERAMLSMHKCRSLLYLFSHSDELLAMAKIIATVKYEAESVGHGVEFPFVEALQSIRELYARIHKALEVRTCEKLLWEVIFDVFGVFILELKPGVKQFHGNFILGLPSGQKHFDLICACSDFLCHLGRAHYNYFRMCLFNDNY